MYINPINNLNGPQDVVTLNNINYITKFYYNTIAWFKTVHFKQKGSVPSYLIYHNEMNTNHKVK